MVPNAPARDITAHSDHSFLEKLISATSDSGPLDTSIEGEVRRVPTAGDYVIVKVLYTKGQVLYSNVPLAITTLTAFENYKIRISNK
jgi:hypothetical protein